MAAELMLARQTQESMRVLPMQVELTRALQMRVWLTAALLMRGSLTREQMTRARRSQVKTPEKAMPVLLMAVLPMLVTLLMREPTPSSCRSAATAPKGLTYRSGASECCC